MLIISFAHSNNASMRSIFTVESVAAPIKHLPWAHGFHLSLSPFPSAMRNSVITVVIRSDHVKKHFMQQSPTRKSVASRSQSSRCDKGEGCGHAHTGDAIETQNDVLQALGPCLEVEVTSELAFAVWTGGNVSTTVPVSTTCSVRSLSLSLSRSPIKFIELISWYWRLNQWEYVNLQFFMNSFNSPFTSRVLG